MHHYFILIILSVFFTSCASYVRTVGTRMISPETNGKLWSGSAELRIQASKRDKLNFVNDQTTNSIDHEDTPHALGAMADLGLLKRLDAFIMPSMMLSPTVYGLKFQFIGSPRSEAKKGNFSTSLLVGYGKKSESVDDDDLSDFFASNVDALTVETLHKEIGLIAGYRWHSRLLHYVNAIYGNQSLKGKVTTDNNVLQDKKFKYGQDGIIYSTGLIYYFKVVYLKADFSHFISDWTHTGKQTVNTANFAWGFNW